MTTEKMLRMKILSNVMLIVAVLLLLVGIGVFFGPTLKYEAELSQSNQEYEDLAEQQLLPADQKVTDQVETATDSGNNDLTQLVMGQGKLLAIGAAIRRNSRKNAL